MRYNLATVSNPHLLPSFERKFTYTAVVPLHNGRTTIEATLASIKSNLSYRDSCIIVENCSSDGSYEFVKSQLLDDRFSLLSTKKPGASNARNIGVRRSKADFIAFCDADDIWYENKLDVADFFLTEKNASLFFHSLDTSSALEGDAVKLKNLPRSKTLIEDLCIYGDFLATSSVVIARDGLGEQMFLDDLTHCQDYEAWCNWALHRDTNISAVYCDTPLGYYEKENGLSKNTHKREISHYSIVWHYSKFLPLKSRLKAIWRNWIRAFYRAILKRSFSGLKSIITTSLQRIDR